MLSEPERAGRRCGLVIINKMSISLSQFGFMIDIHDSASHGCDSNSFLLGGSGMASTNAILEVMLPKWVVASAPGQILRAGKLLLHFHVLGLFPTLSGISPTASRLVAKAHLSFETSVLKSLHLHTCRWFLFSKESR